MAGLGLDGAQGRRAGRVHGRGRRRGSSRGCSTTSPRTRSRELFTLTVLVHRARHRRRVGAASSACRWRSARSSPGMVVGRSDFSLRAASEALPMRDAFAVLFFVSVGMLLDPRYLLAVARADRSATLAVVLIGKPLVALADRPAAAVSVRASRWRSRWRWRRSASSRSSWPTSARDLGILTRGRHEHARRGLDRLDRAQPAAVPAGHADRAVGCRAAARSGGC